MRHFAALERDTAPARSHFQTTLKEQCHMNIYDLPSIPVGRSCTIDYVADSAMAGRLYDLGFTPGASVECLFAAPSGNPRAYLIRGTVIALRNSDAAAIKARY